ncbi:hypothetical protein COO60DRAFT_653536 [Scenedesmus sp. NREL 46B-D3]|nr:hypothetical protein COO60DRAFT_653536 [Scenedesmus sp. NREL 46B-D3]
MTISFACEVVGDSALILAGCCCLQQGMLLRCWVRVLLHMLVTRHALPTETMVLYIYLVSSPMAVAIASRIGLTSMAVTIASRTAAPEEHERGSSDLPLLEVLCIHPEPRSCLMFILPHSTKGPWTAGQPHVRK